MEGELGLEEMVHELLVVKAALDGAARHGVNVGLHLLYTVLCLFRRQVLKMVLKREGNGDLTA